MGVTSVIAGIEVGTRAPPFKRANLHNYHVFPWVRGRGKSLSATAIHRHRSDDAGTAILPSRRSAIGAAENPEFRCADLHVFNVFFR
jgi:hypothetical protein